MVSSNSIYLFDRQGNIARQRESGKAPQRTKINTPFELISGAVRLDCV